MYEQGDIVMYQGKLCSVVRLAGKMNVVNGVMFKYDLICIGEGCIISGVSDVELIRVE